METTTSFVEIGLDLGATYLGSGRCRFRVWAPAVENVEVRLLGPNERLAPLRPQAQGYHAAVLEGVEPGVRYLFRLDGGPDRPDPASRFQPEGVHGPSQVVSTAFDWDEAQWTGLPWKDYILYEIHVGTFTPQGTFEAVIGRLGDLKELGVTAIELMPIAQFPGTRNWGYDGVHPFAAQESYGGPEGFKRLVEACHREGLAVVLDVVYNHLGPEGNYLGEFGPYFTSRYRTPWGEAVNFDGPHSDEVRFFFIQSALYWIGQLHIDALRLDAVHAIFDQSARPFLQELGEAVHAASEHLGRRVYVVAESNLNDPRHVRPVEQGGFGLDAQWNDDLHHALHTLLTGERDGYYADFGRLEHLTKALAEGFVYTGQYSQYRQRRHGATSRECAAEQFVVFGQNHDQVGNRMMGERLSRLVGPEELKLAAAVVLLSPYVPLLFMGEEYAERAPFQYFISHLDVGLVEAVRRGRREEFARFRWRSDPPDPYDEQTFQRCQLRDEAWRLGREQPLRPYYQELIRLRKTVPALTLPSKEHSDVTGLQEQRMIVVRRWCADDEALIVYHFGDAPQRLDGVPATPGRWQKQLDSAEQRWGGTGSEIPEQVDADGRLTLEVRPKACVLLTRTEAV